METKLNVKWSFFVKIVTFAVLLVLVGAEYYIIQSLIQSMDWLMLIIAIIIPGVALYFSFEAPLSIGLTESFLVLHKLNGKLIIDYDQIAYAEIYKPDISEIRLMGSGGVFGYIGKFSNATIGKYQSYVGDYAQSFLIQTKDDKKYVFSCENRDLVISTIKKNFKK
jgi:hypothetical protein